VSAEKKQKFLDPNIGRKSKIIKDTLNYIKGTKIPLPSLVEISDSGTCNRTCSFCPRSDPDYEDIKEFISEKLHTSICEQLGEHDYSGMLIYSGFSEPLLNKNIYKNISVARKNLPNAKIELITNGDPLTENNLIKLFESGLSTLLISVYDSKEDAVMFDNLCKKNGLIENQQYVIRHRYLPQEMDFGLTISNRGGLLKNAEYVVQPLKESLKLSCSYPSYHFFIDYNGDVLKCSQDWGKKNILGNLNKKSLIEIWTSKLAKTCRQRLEVGDRNFEPCNVCDISGDLIGSTHAKAWSEYYK
jgi:radical SAM protein with 4Fe4S-binding SPASM domain